MKQKISLVVAFIMLFNLSVGVFAQSIPGFTSPKGNYFPQLEQAKTATNPLVLATEEQRKEQEIVSTLGLNPTEYKKAMEQYAKAKKIDINTIDLSASYQAYSKEILKYYNDYQAVIKIFNKKTYLEVLTEAKSFIGEKGNIVSYQGKKYNKVAIYHAALHNLATRTLSGYTQNSTFVFGSESNKEFNIKEKVAVMDFIYRVISNDGFYPKDQEALYKMAKEVLREGKEYFKSTKEHNDEAHDAKGVVAAISVLTALSNTSAKKQESAQVIYALSKSVMRKDLGAMGILSGSEALLTLNTEDSLNKLYTLLAEDLYRGWGTELVMFVTETFSIEELQQRLAGFTSELNKGLGQYHNAIARRYVYVDPNKNSYDQKRLAESRDETLANYSKVIYTDIFEEIGKEIGRRTKDPKVAKLASRFANKYYSELNAAKQNTAEPQKNASGFITAVNNKTAILSRADSPLKRETKIHTSLIVGILSTTKQKEENLTKAARVIYNGNWWDINEITQRDKNNAAAKYLNLQKKPFNQRKQDMYALVIRTKNTAKFVDVFAQAAMLGQMVVSMPAMIGRVSNWARNISKWFKVEAKPAGVAKPVVAKPVEVKPVVKSAPAKPVEIKPMEAKPIEVKPIEVKPLEMPKVAPKVVEPVKVPVFAEPIKVPAAQVAKVTPEVAQSQVTAIAREVKYDILGKYYQKPAAMSVLPFGLSGISKRLSFFLTGRVYLSETKIAKVKAIVDEAAKSLIPEITEGKIPQAELRNSLLDRTFAKIQESADFTAEEKADLFRGREPVREVKPVEEGNYVNSEISDKSKIKPEKTNTDIVKTEESVSKGAEVAADKAPANIKPEVVARQKAKKHFKKYRKAYREHNIEEAYNNINEAIKYDPENAAYYHERAMLEYYNFENYMAGMEDMRMAHKLNPGNSRYGYILEERWGKELEAREAKAKQEAKLAEEQKNVESQDNSKSYSQKVYDKLVEEGKISADVKPEAVGKQLANKNFKKYKRARSENKIQEAYEYINEAIKYDPENAAYYHERAIIEYYNFENHMAGMEDMRMAHKLNPGNSRYGYILEERWGKELAAKETTKVPAKTEAKKPEIAKTEAEQTEVQQIAKQVKSDILNKYNDNTLMMSFFPTGFFGKIGKRVKAFLTNKPYLSEDKMAKVRTLIDEAANEVATEKLPRSEAKAVVKVRSNFKIYESADFTAQEKLDLIGAKDRKKLADYYYSAYEAANGAENYELALYNINKAIELDPTNANFYHRKALKEYYYFDQKEQAIETMKKAARYNDDADFTLYEDIVKKWSEELKYLKEKQAQKATRQAELKAEQEAARQAELARQQEAARQAELKAKQEAATKKDLAERYFNEARIYSKEEKFQKSLELYNKAIELDPNSGFYYFFRALLKKYQLRDFEGGMDDLKQAVKYDKTTYKDILDKWTQEEQLKAEQEAARQAELARQEEARLKAEQEAARQAELARQEEARLKAEQEAARQAELARQQEAARQAKLKAKQEAARQAELARQEEIKKKRQENIRKARAARQEKARLRAEQEAARQADFQAELSQRVNEKMLTKDYKGAIEDYSDLIKIDEKGYYYYRRAEAYLKTGQKDLAKADYKKGIELDPRSVLRDSHDFDGLKAELKIEKAQEYSQKANNSMQRGDNLTAVDFAKTALKYDPSNLEYKTLLDKAEKAVTSEEYYARALEYKKYRHIQLAYKDFEMAINKATDKALKAQYSFEQARLLRYAKGRGKEGHTIHNEKSNHLVSYSEAALRSYDRAVEYAPNNKVKVQYLLERADFKRFNKDFEGAKADTELANKIEKVRTREAERYKAKKEAESKDKTL